MTDAGAPPPALLPPLKADPRVIAAIVASALFMQNLDSAAVTTALPAMALDLGVDPARLGAAITSYLVALTVFIPFSSWIADRFGAKRVFMAAIAIFTVASVLCGRANSVPEMIGARIFQGLGGAMMVPVARLLLLRQIRKEEMLSAMAWLTMPAMIGPISGPPLGGFLTDMFGWRSVFLINVPIGILGLALVAWKIPHVPPSDPGPPDRRGLVLIGLALALFMFGLETIGRHVMPAGMPEAGLVLGVMFGWAAIRHCRQTPRPALDLSLLQIRTFSQGTLSGSLFRIGAGATPFLVPMLLQVGFGKTASEAGLVSFATALGALAMKPLARPILRRFGFRSVLIGTSVLAAAGIAVAAGFSPAWPLWLIFALLALGGLFRSLQFTALNTLSFADVPTSRLSAATSFSGTAQQLAPALGVVLATTSLEISTTLGGHSIATVHDFSIAFLVAAAVVLASCPFFLRLSPDAGEEVSGHHSGAAKQAAE